MPASDTDAGFVPGTLLNQRYEAVSPLNHGSFGTVFLAKDITNNEQVAIKCLSKSSTPAECPALTIDDNSVELMCHSRLGHHANIVNMLDSFETDAYVYLVLEYCSQGDLYEAIRHGHGPLETENVREFMLQLVGAVEFMHARGLYHRDIKPENIFLAHDGSLKLGDLGLATSDALSFESAVGSDRYMAPEQYDPTDLGYAPAQADIWAIGICLLNVLFARNPFVTPTESDVLFADFARDNKSLFDIFPTMSDGTFQILISALAIDPRKRSLAAVRSALEAVVSFTTDADVLDEFCTEMRDALPLAQANREPLRTPSISSPPNGENTGAFPWSKALHTSQRPAGRQLSAIADTENYTEDLFPASETDRRSWVSWAQNSSVTSGLDSTWGASVRSMALTAPPPRNNLPRSRPMPVPIPSSLPSRMPTLSSIFGRKDNAVSKSWTDMYDEDEEASQHEAAQEAATDAKMHAWSRKMSATAASHTPSPLMSSLRIAADADEVNPENEPVRASHDSTSEIFSFEESTHDDTAAPALASSSHSGTESSQPKRTILDRWAALGNRRRQFEKAPVHESKVDEKDKAAKRSLTSNWRTGFGLKAFSTTSVTNTADTKHAQGSGVDAAIPITMNHQAVGKTNQEAANARVLDWRRNTHTPHYQSQMDLGWDIEWVGDLN